MFPEGTRAAVRVKVGLRGDHCRVRQVWPQGAVSPPSADRTLRHRREAVRLEPEADCPHKVARTVAAHGAQACQKMVQARRLICLALKPPSYMRRKPEHHQGRKEEGSVIDPIPDAVSSP